jgi:hypothetical protein
MKKLILACILFVILFPASKAQQNAILAGEIVWFQIGVDSFMIKMDLYRDCNGGDFDTAEIRVVCNSTQTEITRLKMPKSSATDITPMCKSINPDLCSRCSDSSCSFPFGYERYSYVSFLDLSNSSCCEIKLEYINCCRSLEISNGGAGSDFYLYSIFNKCLQYPDNAPSFTMSSLTMLPLHFEAVIYTYGNDIDVDSSGGPLDSFTYEFSSPMMVGTPMNYNPPFSYSAPFTFDGFPDTSLALPQGLHLSNFDGTIRFLPRQIETSVFAIKIKQFRDGIYTGEVLRNFYVNFYQLPSNFTPEINADAYYKEVYPDSTVQFTISTFDADTNDIITLVYTPSFPNGNYESNSGKAGVKRPYAKVSWKPDAVYISPFPYTFELTAKDNFCPINASVTEEFEMMVLDPNASIEEEFEEMKIYPNPIKSEATFEVLGIKQAASLKIMNLQGKIVHQQSLVPHNKQNIQSRLSPGIYVLEVCSQGALYRKKILVQ